MFKSTIYLINLIYYKLNLICFLLVFSAVDHLSAYYQSCDSFPVAVVTGLDLQDEESIVIAKSVSPLHYLYVQETICMYKTPSVHTTHHLYVQDTVCTYNTPSVRTRHRLYIRTRHHRRYIQYTTCTFSTSSVCTILPFVCPVHQLYIQYSDWCSVTGVQ